MYLRPAEPSDEPAIASLCTRAFFNEDLFGRVIHPHRALYPDDVQIFWHEAVRSDWANPRNKVLVVVSPSSPSQPEDRVVGAAIWQRQGDDDSHSSIQELIQSWRDPQPYFPAIPTTLQHSNRALDPSKKDILKQSAEFTKHYWVGSNARNWYLNLCAVDPAFAGRGCGKMLVRWGIERAREEGVAASVTSSEGTNGFYLRCGFDEVVGNASEGERNPLREAGVKGGDILFMWAKES